MGNNFKPTVSIETFAAYLDNNLDPQDMQIVSMQVELNDDLAEIVQIGEECDRQMNEEHLITDEIMNVNDFELPQVNGLAGSLFEDVLVHQDNVSFGQLTADDIQQSLPDDCAIKSQQIILESEGINVSEEELVKEAYDNNWYTPGGGTSPEDVGNLLESKGMTVERLSHCSISDIADELSQGHHIIVGVDSGELWEPGMFENFEDLLGWQGADHALIVSGIQLNPLTNEQEIILTDPGTGEVASTYSVEQFNDAWADSDNFMVVSY
ncbi:MAG: C39 family peptidase [Candidatus Onthomorpha sp.]